MYKIIFLCLLFVFTTNNSKSCTTVIAGRNTTTDGSVLYGKSEDDPNQLDYLWYIQRKTHPKGTVIRETTGLEIPQVEETYAYWWDQSPKMMFSNVIINEFGVAFGSDGCGSKEDTSEELEKRGEIVNGGLGFRLRFILAERSKTAREAVLLAKELINKYGYSASGRNLNIVGPEEAWQLQMVCGKHFVARRVQDDEVVILANTFSIREINLDDTENFICSPDIISYAIKREWYNPDKDGEFDFAKTYANEFYHTADWNTHRTWILAKLLQKNFPLTVEEAEAGLMPVSVKPDRKLSVKDMMEIFRNHYENTSLCTYKNDDLSPHYVKNAPLCNANTHKVNIIQQRNWMPVEIGTVNWRALSNPCQSVFVPWYLGINNVPEIYQNAWKNPNDSEKGLLEYHFNGPDWQIWDMDLHSASCVFRLLNDLGNSDYAQNQPLIRAKFNITEETALSKQEQIENNLLELYKKDKDAAIETMTKYSNSLALSANQQAMELISTLMLYK
jgi:dipeptidase